MSNITLTWPASVATYRLLCNCACSCCSWRRSTSDAVLTSVLKALTSSGFGFFLSRPMVHGPTRAGSGSPALIFLILDHTGCPAIAHPQARLLDRGVIVWFGSGVGEGGKLGAHGDARSMVGASMIVENAVA